jgi:hypothetical protein
MTISPLLAGLSPGDSYKVPEGYFVNFATRLMTRIRTMETSVKDELEALSPLLNSIEKKNVFTTPDGYFSELADNLVSGMKAIDFVKEELETPLLQDLKHRTAYTVPAGYFESFPSLLMNKIRSSKEGRVISMQPGKRIMRYAAAAAVVAIIILGAVFFDGDKSQTSSLAASLQADSIVTQNISQLPDQDIIEYVENAVVLADNNFIVTGSAEMDAEDMRVLLTDIPDEELASYVEMHGGEKLLSN